MKLADSLREIAQHLRAIGAPFAVVGGLAASARGEARFTRDIDLAVSVDGDPRAEQVLFELGQQGYRVIATVEHAVAGRLATARSLDPYGQGSRNQSTPGSSREPPGATPAVSPLRSRLR